MKNIGRIPISSSPFHPPISSTSPFHPAPISSSFDHFEDQKAIQVFSALLAQQELILAHETIEGNKTNEIPVAQKLIGELGLSGCVFTADAMHCQKKRWKY